MLEIFAEIFCLKVQSSQCKEQIFSKINNVLFTYKAYIHATKVHSSIFVFVCHIK